MSYIRFNNENFKKVRDDAKMYFETHKTGDQSAYIDNTKFFQPIIDTTKESSKFLQDKIITGQESLTNAIVSELQKRNDQVEMLQNLPYYNVLPGIEDIPQSTPIKERGVIEVDLDGELLDQTHQENLLSMNSYLKSKKEDVVLDLPSVVQKKGNFEKILKAIETITRSHGQYLREDSKKTHGEKEIYRSQRSTLKEYKEKIEGVKGTTIFGFKKLGEGLRKKVLCKLKRGRGRPRKNQAPIVYSDANDLASKLNDHLAAKEAGNTGLDDIIISMMDELLHIGAIDISFHDNLF